MVFWFFGSDIDSDIGGGGDIDSNIDSDIGIDSDISVE